MNSTGQSRPLGWPLRISVGLLIILGIGYGIRMWMQPPTQPDLEDGRAASEEFFTQIREGNPGEAWDASTAEFKSIAGRESFVRLVQKSPLLKEPLQFTSTQKVTVQEQPRTEFLYQSSRSGATVRVLVGYEGGTWKVDRLTL